MLTTWQLLQCGDLALCTCLEWTGENGHTQPWRNPGTDHRLLFSAILAKFGPMRASKACAGFTIVTAEASGKMADVNDCCFIVVCPANAMGRLQPNLTPQYAEQLVRIASVPQGQSSCTRLARC